MGGDWGGFLGILAMVNVAFGSNMDAWKQGMKEEEAAEGMATEEESTDEATEEESPESDEAAEEVGEALYFSF